MKRATIQLAAILFLIVFSSGILAQDEMVCKYPELKIKFSTSQYWTQVIHADDRSGYEFVNLNNNMQVKMWHSATETPVLDFLQSEVCKEGIISSDGPYPVVIDKREAYAICSHCSEMRKPYKVMLIALPTDDGFYLFRFKCPEECYTEHKKQIEEFLGTISLDMVVERSVFYAAKL